MPNLQFQLPASGDFTDLDIRRQRILLVNANAYVLYRNHLLSLDAQRLTQVYNSMARRFVLGLSDEGVRRAIAAMERSIAEHPEFTGPFGINLNCVEDF